jgi:hypothetical protein
METFCLFVVPVATFFSFFRVRAKRVFCNYDGCYSKRQADQPNDAIDDLLQFVDCLKLLMPHCDER